MDCELKTPSRSKATGAVSDSRGCEGVDDIEASCADDESHLQIPEVHRTLENSKLRTNQLVIVHENKRDNLGGSQTKRERDDGQEVRTRFQIHFAQFDKITAGEIAGESVADF